MTAQVVALPAPVDDGTVRAAGALLWRGRGKQLEVAMVHRPKYDDWSWPKGKLDPGESWAEAAVREVLEETGLHARLGIPLPLARYEVGTSRPYRRKVVQYWAAQVGGQRRPPGRRGGRGALAARGQGPRPPALPARPGAARRPARGRRAGHHRRPAAARRPARQQRVPAPVEAGRRPAPARRGRPRAGDRADPAAVRLPGATAGHLGRRALRGDARAVRAGDRWAAARPARAERGGLRRRPRGRRAGRRQAAGQGSSRPRCAPTARCCRRCSARSPRGRRPSRWRPRCASPPAPAWSRARCSSPTSSGQGDDARVVAVERHDTY